MWFIVLFQAQPAHTTLTSPPPPPPKKNTSVHSCPLSTPCGALRQCHNRCLLNNHDANLVHMPGTHFSTGWTPRWVGGQFLPVPWVGSNQQPLGYQSHALPTELSVPFKITFVIYCPLKSMVVIIISVQVSCSLQATSAISLFVQNGLKHFGSTLFRHAY